MKYEKENDPNAKRPKGLSFTPSAIDWEASNRGGKGSGGAAPGQLSRTGRYARRSRCECQCQCEN